MSDDSGRGDIDQIQDTLADRTVVAERGPLAVNSQGLFKGHHLPDTTAVSTRQAVQSHRECTFGQDERPLQMLVCRRERPDAPP